MKAQMILVRGMATFKHGDEQETFFERVSK